MQLIDGEELKTAFPPGEMVRTECVRATIDHMPIIEPRMKGRWIDYTDDGYVECPFCGSATNCDGDISELHYCFSCGADMSSDWFTTQNFGPEEISAEDARRILTEWREQNEH